MTATPEKKSIPRNTGRDADNAARNEADHHMKCPGCFDMSDLSQVLAHVHGTEIEIDVGPEPPARATGRCNEARISPPGSRVEVPRRPLRNTR